MSIYSRRGVSAQKEEVHAAAQQLDQGLYKNAFCKMYPDFLGGDDNYVNVMHADGAGTKSILAYLYWKETGDISIWKGIAQDAIVMNLDDLLCVGIHDNIVFNSTIDRNKHLVPGDVLHELINGSQEVFDMLKTYGINIHYLGGETADVGDVVRTIAVNGTMTARWPKQKIISNELIKPGDVIVGLAGFGRAAFETDYNSGIGSNGLTSARHDILSKYYRESYKESYDVNLPDDIAYIGKHKLTDPIEVDGESLNIGKLLLSPTRSFAPVLKELLENDFNNIHGLIHCSGGGQTKCLKYLPGKMKVVKDKLFEPPLIFKLIQEASKSDDREMYQVFNMGCRMEIYTDERFAPNVMNIAGKFGIESRIIGRVEDSDQKSLEIKLPGGSIMF